jgi:hypothetical protein
LIFLGIHSDYLSVYARGLYGRMTKEDYNEAETFVRRYINPDFNAATLKAIVDAAGNEKKSKY